MGFKRWGFKEIRGYLRKKAFFLRYLGFPKCSSGPLKKGEKGREKAKKADFGRFPGWEARHPLKPHLLHPHLRHSNKTRSDAKCETKSAKNALKRPRNCLSPVQLAKIRKVQMGALKWGLKATLCNLCTIVCNCALSWPFVKGTFVTK